jgi:hypothetical protein
VTRKFDFTFIRNIGAASLIILILGFYPVYVNASQFQMISFVYGYAVCIVNILIGFGLYEISLEKQFKVFVSILFGGMAVRIFLSAGLLALIIFAGAADDVALIGSFFFFYVIFTAMELHYVNKRKGTV